MSDENGWAPCSALDERTRTCRHGFFVTYACCPNLKAEAYFRSKPLVPMCCNEDWCARMWPETGAPPFPARREAVNEREEAT